MITANFEDLTPEIAPVIGAPSATPTTFSRTGDIVVSVHTGDIRHEADENRLAEKVARKVSQAQLDEWRSKWR